MHLKKLMEQKEALQKEMQDILNKAEAEERAINKEEAEKFDELEGKIKDINKTIEAEQRARALNITDEVDEDEEGEERAAETEEAEERAFEDYVRGVVSEQRADVNLVAGDNGAVIPSSIANKIIKKVHDICPVYQLATKYNVGGTLSIPYYDETDGNITMAYATEFTELESTSGKFKSIELKGFLAGALSKISKSLINNSQFAIVPFVVNEMAASISRWIENELLNGTTDKIEGLSKVSGITAKSSTAVTSDELIDVQEEIPDVFQANAIWIMNKKTRTAIRKLKDNDGNYILNKDATSRWGYTLFGKDVYTSENMPEMAAGNRAILYGDMSGLAVKISETMNIEVLREKYATQHAIGVVAWMELDSKVENSQKITGLTMA